MIVLSWEIDADLFVMLQGPPGLPGFPGNPGLPVSSFKPASMSHILQQSSKFIPFSNIQSHS